MPPRSKLSGKVISVINPSTSVLAAFPAAKEWAFVALLVA